MQKIRLLTMHEKNRKKIINSLISKYPFLKCKVLSKSLCQRNIEYLKIGKSNRSSVLFVGATHGMEWITSNLLFKFLDDICANISNHKKILGIDFNIFLKTNSLIVLPCLNPDGVEIQLNGYKASGKYSNLVKKISCANTDFWQSNARGVDINHNFDAGWKKIHKLEQKARIISASATRYGGQKPFSEPESKAIKKICAKINFRHVISFHSQGKEIYWHYGKNTPKRSKNIAQLFSSLSSYKISNPTGMAIGGGLKDWFIQKHKKPGFTIEVGKGKNPLSIKSFPQIYKDLFEIMVFGAVI